MIIKKHYNTNLLQPALKGLAKYSGSLNIEIILDLVKNLISLVKEDKIKGPNRFHCIFSCIKIISTSHALLKFEDKDLTKILYNALLFPPTDKSSQKIMISALSWLLIEQKQYSFDLISAFLKRIMQIAFHCDLPLMKSFLCLSKQVMCKFNKAYLLMEADDSSDSFLPLMNDPYLAQAASSSLLPQIQMFSKVDDPEVAQILKTFSHKLPSNKKPLDFF